MKWRTLPGRACLLTPALLVACANPVRLVPLASGTPGQQAWELHGREPAELRAEAHRLCRNGAPEVVREAFKGVRLAQTDAGDAGWEAAWSRWRRTVQDSLQEQPRQAQLVVRCPQASPAPVLQAAVQPVLASPAAVAPVAEPKVQAEAEQASTPAAARPQPPAAAALSAPGAMDAMDAMGASAAPGPVAAVAPVVAPSAPSAPPVAPTVASAGTGLWWRWLGLRARNTKAADAEVPYGY